jgi:hypothetical protein
LQFYCAAREQILPDEVLLHSMFDMPNSRDNDIWLKALRGAGAERDAALADLRALLFRDLPHGLSM